MTSSVPSVREIFDAHAPFVWRTLRYLGVPDAELSDQTQEVFLVVHKRIGDFEGRSSIQTWLYGICFRVAAARRRRAHVRREDVTDQLPEPVGAATQDEAVERRRNLTLLRSVVDDLPEDRRAVFVLYEIEELPMKEVAEAVGCPLQTAYSRLHAAREQVRREFKRALLGGGSR